MEDIAASCWPGDCGASGESLHDLEEYALDAAYSFEGQDYAQRAYRKLEKVLPLITAPGTPAEPS